MSARTPDGTVATRERRSPPDRAPLPWIRVCPSAPYFETEHGRAWTPIGHNEALTWPRMSGAVPRLDEYFGLLQQNGVSCLRLMLEYAQRDTHYLEQPVGTFNPRLVRRWDRIFRTAERHGIRLLLTPFDTFWMWKRWAHHPYNARHGGPCRRQRTFLTSSAAREAIKARFAFAIDRWAGSGALFAWDLWNEIHPAYAEDDAGHFDDFITDVGSFVRERERARYGRTHPLTVSAFGPMLTDRFWSRELGSSEADQRARHAIYRHPALDFATVHTYAHGTIDAPTNTVDPAVAMGELTAAAVDQTAPGRPYFDSEHGPIHTFKDKRRTLAERFDDEYFRHVQWAHLASGGAGGGMRWPNRHPHQLTDGMHRAQRALAGFAEHLHWAQFRRTPRRVDVTASAAAVAAFCCSDERQAIVWLLRRGPFSADGTLAGHVACTAAHLTVPGLMAGRYEVVAWDTEAGCTQSVERAEAAANGLELTVPLHKDIAVAIRPLDS